MAKPYQDAAHYYLPSNIYDNLPSGVETPAAVTPIPSPAPTLPQSRSFQRNSTSPPPGPDDPPSIDISTPLLNAVYTPGSDLIMTWSHNGIEFPDDWTPQQGLLDTITNDPNFSHSPLLTKNDMTNLAKMKLEDLKRSQLVSIMNDSPIWLNSLRLVSSRSPATSPGANVVQKREVSISPNILFDPGYNLQGVSKAAIVGGGSGGQLTWTIPADWEYEGEFEIRIPSLSSSNQDKTNDKDAGTRSSTFWILRDDATRKTNPQFVQPPTEGMFSPEGSSRGHRALNIFLSVSAMILALVLLGLGFVIGVYRRKRAATATGNPPCPFPTSSVRTRGAFHSSVNVSSFSPSTLMTKGIGSWFQGGQIHRQKHETDLLERVPGDEDAHSPTSLCLSESTLSGGASQEHDRTEAVDDKSYPKTQSGLLNTEDGTFVDLPLCDDDDDNDQDSPSTTNEKRMRRG
ncbi:hypothetical protein BGX31_001264 [Mortierella sp. GBA43]|nr:hypothetical protein BGX31_001264 [Mortierella sp. GBA43]